MVQHARDAKLINNLISFLGCGTFWLGSSNAGSVLNVRKLSDITSLIIPLFEQHPLHGTKKLDYLDFCRVAALMNKKEHLTLEGLDVIRGIKAGMNSGRAS